MRERQLRPRVLGTLLPVLRRTYTSANASAAASADASANARALAETDIAADASTLKSTVTASDKSSVACADTKPDAAAVDERAASGADAAADDPVPDARRRQPNGGARCCTDHGPRHRRIHWHLR